MIILRSPDMLYLVPYTCLRQVSPLSVNTWLFDPTA